MFTSIYLYPHIWKLFVLMLALLLGAAGWLRAYEHVTAIQWLGASLAVGAVMVWSGLSLAPDDVVIDVAMSATRFGCAQATNALRVDAVGAMSASWFDIARARYELLGCIK